MTPSRRRGEAAPREDRGRRPPSDSIPNRGRRPRRNRTRQRTGPRQPRPPDGRLGAHATPTPGAPPSGSGPSRPLPRRSIPASPRPPWPVGATRRGLRASPAAPAVAKPPGRRGRAPSRGRPGPNGSFLGPRRPRSEWPRFCRSPPGGLGLRWPTGFPDGQRTRARLADGPRPRRLPVLVVRGRRVRAAPAARSAAKDSRVAPAGACFPSASVGPRRDCHWAVACSNTALRSATSARAVSTRRSSAARAPSASRASTSKPAFCSCSQRRRSSDTACRRPKVSRSR